jgi:Lamin Tail Domain
MKNALIFTAILAACVLPAGAAITISEVAPWSSSSLVGADWFELTNTGGATVIITGWKVDDNSNAFGSSLALNGITSIAPGESVIFIETANLGTASVTFMSTWFGANPPAGLQIGNYTGSMIGLGSGGDAVNIFDGGGAVQANVTFGASPAGPVFATFDNAAGLTGAISQLSVAGVNGAFVAAGDSNEIGSPGRIVSPVPEPSSAVLLAAAAGVLGIRRRR